MFKWNLENKQLTSISGLSAACTNAQDSRVTGRTVSVRPSLKSRIIEASYVRLKRSASYLKKKQIINTQYIQSNILAKCR